MKLYGYWRSLAAFRVRIALNLKGLPFDVESLDLVKGDQFSDAYREINPQMVVPALVDGDLVLTQSMAILEYLEDLHPEPSLLPADPADRARVRSICLISVADTHPLVVPRIRKYVTQELGHSEEELTAWIQNWLTAGLAAIEENLANNPATGTYCHGGCLSKLRPWLAICCDADTKSLCRPKNQLIEIVPSSTKVSRNLSQDSWSR